jgi:hypothetical protein
MCPLTPLLDFLQFLVGVAIAMVIIPLSFALEFVAEVKSVTHDSVVMARDNASFVATFVGALGAYWVFNEWVQQRPLHVPSCFVRAWNCVVGCLAEREEAPKKVEGRGRKTVEFEDLSDLD